MPFESFDIGIPPISAGNNLVISQSTPNTLGLYRKKRNSVAQFASTDACKPQKLILEFGSDQRGNQI